MSSPKPLLEPIAPAMAPTLLRLPYRRCAAHIGFALHPETTPLLLLRTGRPALQRQQCRIIEKLCGAAARDECLHSSHCSSLSQSFQTSRSRSPVPSPIKFFPRSRQLVEIFISLVQRKKLKKNCFLHTSCPNCNRLVYGLKEF
jgi:hypothetical protein